MIKEGILPDVSGILKALEYQADLIMNQAKLIENQGDRLFGIEKAITAIAVQEEKIVNVQVQLSALWKKYDNAFGPEGIISKLQTQAASCPKNDLKNTLTGQWVAIGIIVTLIGVLKLWG